MAIFLRSFMFMKLLPAAFKIHPLHGVSRAQSIPYPQPPHVCDKFTGCFHQLYNLRTQN